MAERTGFGRLQIVHGCDLKMKGALEKGLCEIHCDITAPKDTNASCQGEINGLTSKGPVAVITSIASVI